MKDKKLASTWSLQILSLTAVAAACALAACGGDDDDVSVPQPLLSQASGPLALSVDAASPFALPAITATEYDKHRQTATANAGSGPMAVAGDAPYTNAAYDPVELRRQWCFSAENAGNPAELADRSVVPPTKLFDNMWTFGYHEVVQYGFKTDNGKLFFIDTLNSTADAQTITEPGMQAMGLSGASLEGAMPTHGHGDHYGGAGYLQQKYGIPIYLGSGDAAVGPTAGSTPNSVGVQLPFTVTPLDSANLQPQDKDFGGFATTLLSTPGHTPGTFSGVVPVKLNGQTYRLAFWGGTAMPGTLDNAKKYQDGAERLYQLAAAKKVDGTMHTHSFVDGSWQKIQAIRSLPAATTNPFLIGTALSLRSFSILRECAAAKVAQLDATAKIAPWHTTTLTLQVAKSPTSQVLAVLRNPYGPLQNAPIVFTVAPNGQTCTAYTDAKGQASCNMAIPAGSNSAVTADFKQSVLADGSVELASSGSVSAN